MKLSSFVIHLNSFFLGLRLLTNSSYAQGTNGSFNAIVSADGSGTYTNLESAIAAAPDNGTNTYSILIKLGIYPGPILVPKTKAHLRLVGEEVDRTTLTYALNMFETNGATISRYTGIGVVVLADDFHAENLTFENTSGDHGQALALRVDGDRATFNHCRLVGWQDTVRLEKGRDYFTNCYIAGRVDFIYGSATAVFDRCEIHSRNGGHVTAADTPERQPFGFVFMNCRLTGNPQPWINPQGVAVNTNKDGSVSQADLGRPWRPYACVTYLNCEMGGHIKPAGWNNWRNPANESTARFAEYNSTGPGANPEQRFKWSRQLTKAEADKITIASVLAGSDHWNPAVQP